MSRMTSDSEPNGFEQRKSPLFHRHLPRHHSGPQRPHTHGPRAPQTPPSRVPRPLRGPRVTQPRTLEVGQSLAPSCVTWAGPRPLWASVPVCIRTLGRADRRAPGPRAPRVSPRCSFSGSRVAPHPVHRSTQQPPRPQPHGPAPTRAPPPRPRPRGQRCARAVPARARPQPKPRPAGPSPSPKSEGHRRGRCSGQGSAFW